MREATSRARRSQRQSKCQVCQAQRTYVAAVDIALLPKDGQNLFKDRAIFAIGSRIKEDSTINAADCWSVFVPAPNDFQIQSFGVDPDQDIFAEVDSLGKMVEGSTSTVISSYWSASCAEGSSKLDRWCFFDSRKTRDVETLLESARFST